MKDPSPSDFADLLDQYVAEHENDPGRQSFMERNAIVMSIIHHVAGIIRKAVKEYDK